MDRMYTVLQDTQHKMLQHVKIDSFTLIGTNETFLDTYTITDSTDLFLSCTNKDSCIKQTHVVSVVVFTKFLFPLATSFRVDWEIHRCGLYVKVSNMHCRWCTLKCVVCGGTQYIRMLIC